jgi:hypothetical protein
MFFVEISFKIKDNEGVVILYLGNYSNLLLFIIMKSEKFSVLII